MMKVLILFQTILVFLTPLAATPFNTSLGNTTRSGTVIVPSPYHPTPFQTVDKVIKESRIAPTDYQIKTVVIDAGHGGHDSGCLGGSSQEKHLALGIAKRLAALIQTTHPQVKVIMTRDEDVFIPLYQRAAIANRNKADLFISIHCNFLPGSSVTRGSETYVMGLHTAEHNLQVAKRENESILLEADYEKNYDYDPNSPEGHIMLTMFQSAHLEQSILFAEKVEAKIKESAERRSRGVKQAGFVVLKETTMPSVLVEAGFLSNAKEEAFLKTAAGQQKIAQALLEAFSEYKSTVESPTYLQFTQSFKEVASLPKADQPEAIRTSFSSYPEPPAQRPTTGPPSGQPQAVPTYQRSNNTPQPQPQRIYTNVYRPPANTPASGEANPTDNSTLQIQFFVQLAASSKQQNTSESKWKNLPYPVEVVQEDQLYKYRARNFANLSEAQQAKALIRTKGFKDAFIVAYKNGKRISVEQAKKELKLP